jgi:hypothetical protein
MDRRQRPWWLWALAGLVALAAIILVVWKLPSLLYGDVSKASPDARLQAASGFRTAFIAGLAGLAALGSLAMATRTYRLTQQGQITDRYTKAIEQLGGDKLDVRLGGIYALERIAKDSERDHPTVVEVLSAFVREHSPPAILPSTAADDADGRSSEPLLPPSTEVQAAVTVLGRLPQRRDVSRGDLRGADLHRVNLWSANLQGAHLRGVNLEWANLGRASLEGANLGRASLEGASLEGAHLRRANLRRANLGWAKLQGANLEGASLEGAYLEGAEYNADTVWPDGFDWKAAGVGHD